MARHISLWAYLSVALCACSFNELPSAVCQTGVTSAREGKYDDAVKIVSGCLVLPGLPTSDRVEALQARAWAYANLGQHGLAVDDQEAAFKIQPPSQYNEFINYASYLRNVGRFKDSLDAVLGAEKIEAGKLSMMTQYNKGWSLLDLGRYDEAVEAFTKGIPVQPDYAFVYWRRGLAYEGLRNKQMAQNDFEQCAHLLIANNNIAAAGMLLPAIREKLRQYGLDKKISL